MRLAYKHHAIFLSISLMQPEVASSQAIAVELAPDDMYTADVLKRWLGNKPWIVTDRDPGPEKDEYTPQKGDFVGPFTPSKSKLANVMASPTAFAEFYATKPGASKVLSFYRPSIGKSFQFIVTNAVLQGTSKIILSNPKVISGRLLTSVAPRPVPAVVRRKMIGLTTVDVPSDLIGEVTQSSNYALIVDKVLPGAPGDLAGIIPGDVILKVNGLELSNKLPLPTVIDAVGEDGVASLQVRRNDRTETLNVYPVTAAPNDFGIPRTGGVVAVFTLYANKGSILAQRSLGSIYRTGDRVAKNPDSALYWYNKAAAAGDVISKSALAAMYWEGEGTPRDRELAEKLWRQAASSGDASAVRALGIIDRSRQESRMAEQKRQTKKSGGGFFGQVLGAVAGGAVTGWSAEGMITGLRMAQGGDAAQEEYDRLSAQTAESTERAQAADARLQSVIAKARQSPPVTKEVSKVVATPTLDPAVIKQLAAANAYRDKRLSMTTDPAERARLTEQNRQVDEVAKRYGIEDQVRQIALNMPKSNTVLPQQQRGVIDSLSDQNMGKGSLCPDAPKRGHIIDERTRQCTADGGATHPIANKKKIAGGNDGTSVVGGTGGSIMGSSPIPPSSNPPSVGAAVVEWKEGVVICKPSQGVRYRCEGPLQITYASIGTKDGETDLGNACGTTYAQMRDLGEQSGFRAFACGYGIHPTNRSYPGNKDVLDLYSIPDLNGTRTYRCPISKSAYCTTM